MRRAGTGSRSELLSTLPPAPGGAWGAFSAQRPGSQILWAGDWCLHMHWRLTSAKGGAQIARAAALWGEAGWGFRAGPLGAEPERKGTRNHRRVKRAPQEGDGEAWAQRWSQGNLIRFPKTHSKSPVLRSAYRRSVLAPSPDTDSECAVSQATVVITEI